MERVTLKPLLHRNRECIGIYFDKNISIEKIIRRQPGATWSHTNKCWYISLSETGYTSLVSYLKDKALVDYSALKNYLQKKRKVVDSLPELKQNPTAKKTVYLKPVALSAAWQLNPANLKALESFVQQLQLKAYSSSTINTYRNEFMQLLKLLKNNPMQRPDCCRPETLYGFRHGKTGHQ